MSDGTTDPYADYERETVTLDRPVRFGDRTITELTIRDGCQEDLDAMDLLEGKNAKVRQLLSRLSGQPSEVIARLSIRDFARVMEVVNRFLGVLLPE